MRLNMLGDPMTLGEVAYTARRQWFHARYPNALEEVPWWRLSPVAVQEWETIAQAVVDEVEQRCREKDSAHDA